MTQDERMAPAPAHFKLLPHEVFVSAQTHPVRQFVDTPSSLEQLMRLTRSSSPNQIGKVAPALAALTFDVSARTSVAAEISPLDDPTEHDVYPTPDHLRLYETLFGRDSLRTAIDLISSYPELARITTLRLAELQGETYNVRREEEPGKIVHEARTQDDPKALELSEKLGWGWPYYGSVDATPEFIRTLAAYCLRSEEGFRFLTTEYTDRRQERRSMAYALDMAVSWILHKLRNNREGILEFHSVLPTGIENQVWKDSWDAYHHQDGSLANHNQGIASIEVQVTTYDALLDAAELYERALNNTDKAQELREQAKRLKRAIFTLFWTEEKGGYFVLGTDRDEFGALRQLKVRTSNMGHTLNSRLLEGDDPQIIHMRESIVAHILSPSLLTHSGIRTLASDEVRYRPGAYHNGSIWLWDTHHIAKGLRRLGYHDSADDLDRRLLHVVDVTKIFPEYVRGESNGEPRINTQTIIIYDETVARYNTVEQPPQEVQAWTVAAILAIKKRLARRGLLPPRS